MKKLPVIIILTVCNTAFAVFAKAADDSVLLALQQIAADIEQKIQTQIIDPILGKGNAFVFADIQIEVVTREAEQSREGVGKLSNSKSISTEAVTNRYKTAGSDEADLFKVFDFGEDSGSVLKPKAGKDKKQKPEKTEKTAVSPKPGETTKRVRFE